MRHPRPQWWTEHANLLNAPWAFTRKLLKNLLQLILPQGEWAGSVTEYRLTSIMDHPVKCIRTGIERIPTAPMQRNIFLFLRSVTVGLSAGGLWDGDLEAGSGDGEETAACAADGLRGVTKSKWWLPFPPTLRCFTMTWCSSETPLIAPSRDN